MELVEYLHRPSSPIDCLSQPKARNCLQRRCHSGCYFADSSDAELSGVYNNQRFCWIFRELKLDVFIVYRNVSEYASNCNRIFGFVVTRTSLLIFVC